jgi:hypothetical protein
VPTGDRDRVVDQLLRRSAGDLLGAAGPDCVDAETLAAWSEGGLDAVTLQRVDGHLAGCAHCQAMAAALVRSDAAAPAPGRATWGLRWLVPVVATAAAALAIWVLVPRQPGGPVTGQSDQKVAMNGPAAPSVAPAPPPAAELPPGVALTMPELPADSRQQSVAKAEAPVTDALRDQAARANSGGRGPTAAGLMPAAPPPPTPAAALPSPTAPQVPGQRESVQVTAEAPVVQAQSGERSFAVTTTQVENLPISRGNFAGVTAAAPNASARETRVGGAGQNATMMDGVGPMDAGATSIASEFAAPSVAAEPALARSAARAGAAAAPEASTSAPATRWRVLADGRVQRSLTAGASWDAIAIDSTVHVTTGNAPSPMVCWLIGPRGVVLRTTDRLHFERLVFPEAVDLTEIRAATDLAATVTTRDGRTFATIDGGKTWNAER